MKPSLLATLTISALCSTVDLRAQTAALTGPTASIRDVAVNQFDRLRRQSDDPFEAFVVPRSVVHGVAETEIGVDAALHLSEQRVELLAEGVSRVVRRNDDREVEAVRGCFRHGVAGEKAILVRTPMANANGARGGT